MLSCSLARQWRCIKMMCGGRGWCCARHQQGCSSTCQVGHTCCFKVVTDRCTLAATASCQTSSAGEGPSTKHVQSCHFSMMPSYVACSTMFCCWCCCLLQRWTTHTHLSSYCATYGRLTIGFLPIPQQRPHPKLQH